MHARKMAIACFAVVSLAFSQLAIAQAPPAPAVKAGEVGGAAIDFTVTNFETKKDFTLSNELKKGNMLFVWLSSSCSSCLAEVNELKKLQDEGKLKDVAVYTVSIDFNDANLQNYNDSFNHKEFTMLHDKTFGSALKYGFRSTPATLLIGKSGNVVHKATGFEGGESKAILDAIGKAK